MCTMFAPTPRNLPSAARRLSAFLTGILALAMLATGCVEDGNGNGDGGEDQPTGSIVNITTNIRISGEQMVSVVYSAGPEGADVDAFYVEVDSTALNASTIGARVVFAPDLPTGEPPSTVTTLNTAPMPLGIYRIGLNVVSGDETLRVLSLGTIEITTLPEPVFTLPNQNLFEQPGGNIAVAANVGDPENAVQWRLFYVEEGQRPSVPPTQYGTQLAVGTANVAQTTWFTAGVDLGRYEIGIFVTDSGQSIADTVAAGNTDDIKGPFFNPFIVTLTTDPPQVIPPSVVVTQPSTNQNILVSDPTDPNDGNVLLEFSVNVFQGPPSLQFLDVFYDFDGLANTGDEQVVSANLPISTTNAVFRVASIDAGTTAFLGVTATDAVTTPVTAYAAGTVRRALPNEPVLNVTSPATSEPFGPGDTINIRWNLNTVGITEGDISIYIRRLGANGQPINPGLVPADIVTNGLPLTARAFDYKAAASGRFIATVFVELSGAIADLTASSAPFQVTTLPKIYWLGDLLTASNPLRGTIFGGVNFEDNAGSAMAGGTDFDGDGIGDFIIVSRYAKPDALNPSGIGIGEAYLIRGSTALAGRTFNLNTVSTAVLPGMVFTGIPIQNPTGGTETYGIASVFISEDADGDNVGELWFGIPFANSLVTSLNRTLEREGMFVNGGAVAVSSMNSRVQGLNNMAGARILLDEVGMRFNSTTVGPEPRNGDGSENVDQANLCDGNSTWLADRWHYYEGDCPTGQAQSTLPFRGCVNINSGLFESATEDEDPETLVEPRHGFSPVLAHNFVANTVFRTGNEPCWNTPLTRGNLCPSCFSPDPSQSMPPACNDTCVPWQGVLEAAFPTFTPHVSVEPLDPLVTENLFCSAAVDSTGLFSVPPDNPPFGSFGPGTVELLGGIENCQVVQDIVDAIIGNPATILLVRETIINTYLVNRSDGLARSPTFTGFYPDEYVDGAGGIQRNLPIEPLGMRVIGRPMTSGGHEELSLFGTSITQVGRSILISAPRRDAIEGFDAEAFLSSSEIEGAGLIYTFDNFAYWSGAADGTNRIPPKPHMFLAGGGGNTGFIGDVGGIPPGTTASRWDLAVDREFELANLPPTIVGGLNENIETVVNVGDFNGDLREDFAVGSPIRNSGDGAVYVVFRRAASLEGDFILEKLALPTVDANRMDGILVNGAAGAGEGFGAVLAAGVDFNGDEIGDLVVGNPNANGGVGEAIIIFSQTGVVTPAGGTSVDQLITVRQAARIRGSSLDIGSDFGFTVSNIGDVDGDGKDDLAIAAPFASPRFDPTPFDATDALTSFGLDRNGDGQRDDVTGPFGRADLVVNSADELRHAGLVYVILSSTDARLWTGPGGTFQIDIDLLGRPEFQGYILVGRNGERTAANGVVIDGDYLGGGNSADIAQGGNALKAPIPEVGGDRGRGVGIAFAGDINGDGIDDFLIGAQLADPRVNPQTGEGVRNGGEVYLIHGGVK